MSDNSKQIWFIIRKTEFHKFITTSYWNWNKKYIPKYLIINYFIWKELEDVQSFITSVYKNTYLSIVSEFQPSRNNGLIWSPRYFCNALLFTFTIRICKIIHMMTSYTSSRRTTTRISQSPRKQWRIVSAFGHCWHLVGIYIDVFWQFYVLLFYVVKCRLVTFLWIKEINWLSLIK